MFLLFIIFVLFAVISIILLILFPLMIDLNEVQSVSYYAFLLIIALTIALFYIVTRGGGLV